MGDDAECEDVVQQAVLKALTHLRQFGFESSFVTWLTRIIMNKIKQCCLARRLSRLFFLDHATLSKLPLADPTFSPLRECELTEIRNLMRETINMIAAKYRAVIRLPDLTGLSLAENGKFAASERSSREEPRAPRAVSNAKVRLGTRANSMPDSRWGIFR